MAVAQNVKQGIYWKVGGLLPGASSLHVNVSLGETLNPELCPMHSLKCDCYTGYLGIKKRCMTGWMRLIVKSTLSG